jgi:hypothetical protein
MNISKSLIACAIAASLLTGAYAVAANSHNAAVSMYGIGAPMGWPERKELITTIVTKWSAYVQKVEGTNPRAWARSLGATFATASPANMRRAAVMTTYEGMIATLLVQKTTDAAVINTLAKSSTSATLAALASPSSGLVYTMITPCRVIDTRMISSRLAAKSTTNWVASNPGKDFTAQGGAATDCGIPASPAAVVLNVVSVQPSGPGYITLFPYGVAQPLTATINNVFGSDVANETVVKQTVGDVYGFSIYSFASTDVVADAVGYFAAPTSTALSTSIANGVDNQVADAATFAATATCPTGYSVTGGGAVASPSSPGLEISESYPTGSGTGWSISGRNESGGALVVHVRAVCAVNN